MLIFVMLALLILANEFPALNGETGVWCASGWSFPEKNLLEVPDEVSASGVHQYPNCIIPQKRSAVFLPQPKEPSERTRQALKIHLPGELEDQAR